MVRLDGGVGLDAHEDGEAVEGASDVLSGRRGRVLRVNKELDGLCVFTWVLDE